MNCNTVLGPIKLIFTKNDNTIIGGKPIPLSEEAIKFFKEVHLPIFRYFRISERLRSKSMKDRITAKERLTFKDRSLIKGFSRLLYMWVK